MSACVAIESGGAEGTIRTSDLIRFLQGEDEGHERFPRWSMERLAIEAYGSASPAHVAKMRMRAGALIREAAVKHNLVLVGIYRRDMQTYIDRDGKESFVPHGQTKLREIRVYDPQRHVPALLDTLRRFERRRELSHDQVAHIKKLAGVAECS